MRKLITIAILLSCCIHAFATPKNVKQPPSSNVGLLIGSSYQFLMQGDGISTTLTITPSNIPQGFPYGPPLPNLPIVGIYGGPGLCQGDSQITFTGSASGPRAFLLTFSTPPTAGALYTCSAILLFQPQ